MHGRGGMGRLAPLIGLIGCSLIVLAGCGGQGTKVVGSAHVAKVSPAAAMLTATALPDPKETPTTVDLSGTPSADPSQCMPGSSAAPLPTTLTTLYASTDHGVVALNAADGTTRWSHDTGASTHPVAVPDGAQVYVASGAAGTTVAQVMALGASDGAGHWQAQVPGDANAGAQTMRLLAGGGALVAAASDGSVRALDVSTGHALWTAQVAAGPAEVDASLVAGTVYVEFVSNYTSPSAGPETVAAVRVSDGAVLWHVTNAAPGFMPLVVANGLVYAADTPTMLVARNAATGVAHWRVELGAQQSSQPPRNLMSVVVAGTGLYVTAGAEIAFTVLALNASTGALCWISHGDGEGATSAPVLDGTLLYSTAFCGDPGPPSPGTGCVYALDARTGAHRWGIRVNGAYGGIGPASLVNGALYVSNAPSFALRADSGATIWTDSESPFFVGMNVNLGQMQVIGATAYTAYTDGTLRALNAADGSVRWHVSLSGQINGLFAGA
jgi:outer membrane protein assembly factor BamB